MVEFEAAVMEQLGQNLPVEIGKKDDADLTSHFFDIFYDARGFFFPDGKVEGLRAKLFHGFYKSLVYKRVVLG